LTASLLLLLRAGCARSVAAVAGVAGGVLERFRGRTSTKSRPPT